MEQKEINNESDRMTYLTLASAVIGFLTYSFHPLLFFLYIPIFFIPKYHPFIHLYPKVAKLTITTLIFGLINAHTFYSLKGFLQSHIEHPHAPVFSIFLSLMTIYHYFQFQLINNFHHSLLSWTSFLIYHSKQYTIALAFSLTEHILTKYVFDLQYKNHHPLMLLALIIAVAGEGLRIAAFFTCKSNFTHLVRFRKQNDHILITHGIYSFFRHPSYTGYFYFSVFSQLFLGNFLSAIAYVVTLSKFFSSRIQSQEEALIQFFPEYLTYKKKTHILIPFVKDPTLQKSYYPYDRSGFGLFPQKQTKTT